MSPTRRDLLLLLFGCAVVLGVRLGARDLWNPNEPIYGEAVVEMASASSWLVPEVNGHVFGEKPILFFWLALVASKLLGGVSEASLRVPSLIAGLATVAGTYALVWPYAGRGRAVASALVVATLYGVYWNARFVQMDILVTATTVWVIVAVVRVADHGASALAGFAIAGAIAGIGFLAKGPVAWICPGLALGGYLIATRRAQLMLRWEALAGGAVCLLVTAPWLVALLGSGHRDVLVETLFRQNVVRFIEPWDHRAPLGYYLQAFWFDMAPWSFFVPLALARPRRDDSDRQLALLSWIWILATIVFFSLSRSKRSPYILPIAPAVAVLAGEVACAFMSDRAGRVLRRGVVAIVTAFAVILGAAGLFAWGVALVRLEGAVAVAAMAFGVALLLAALLATLVVLDGRLRSWAPVGLFLATVVVYFAAGSVILPALNPFKSARPVCERIQRLAAPEDALVSYAFWDWRAEYRYYLRRPIENLGDQPALRRAWSGPRRVVLLVASDRIGDARQVIGDVVPAIEGRVGGSTIYVFTNR